MKAPVLENQVKVSDLEKDSHLATPALTLSFFVAKGVAWMLVFDQTQRYIMIHIYIYIYVYI